MRKVKVLEDLSIVDIIDMLSELSEIDITLSLEKHDAIKDSMPSSKWLNTARIMENQDLARMLFRGVQNYLQQILEKDPDQLKDPFMRKGIQSLMTFVLEAAEKIDKFTPLFKKTPALESISDLPEYRDLSEYFTSAIAPYMPAAGESDEQWEDEWGIRGVELVDTKRMGLRTVDEIRSDKQYELLYLLKENGRPFYDYEMLRHMRLLYDFDKSSACEETENLFFKVDIVQDKECHLRAEYILKQCGYLIDEFFREALKHKDSQCISNLSMGVMALMLAANPRNLKQTSSSEKTAYGYFLDFHHYLRLSLSSDEYQKLIMISHERRPFQSCLFLLTHKLCSAYFSSTIDHREMTAIIRRQISEGSLQAPSKESYLSGFMAVIEEDAALRRSLQKYPAGAIHKLAKVFERGDNTRGFDPLSQDNIPEQLFAFTMVDKEISCLKMPSPVRQEFIQKAELAQEFEGLIRSLSANSKNQKLLFINLQDRTSWQDYARCTLLEEMAQSEEFASQLILMGLAKSTDFYYQNNDYLDQNDSELFFQQLKDQVLGGAQCGFFFSQAIAYQIAVGLPNLISLVHQVFFAGAKALSQDQRRDFIEITYLFLTLIALDSSEADFICFNDKDTVDASAAASAELFGLCKLLSGNPLSDDDKGLFLYMLYAPALTLRERAIELPRLERTLSALDRIQKGMAERRDLFKKLTDEHGYYKIKQLVD